MKEIELHEKIAEVSKTIFSYCMVKTPTREEAEDLSQDILCELIKSAGNIRDDNNFYAFMWGVAGNVYKQWYRKKLKNNTCELTENMTEDIASDDVKEQLEEYILHDQLEGTGHLYNTIREIKEAIAPIVTTFYCPLTAQVHDDEYGDMNDVGDYEIRAAQYEIEEALEREQNPDFDMAAYITDHPTANDKLVSAVWSVEEIDGVLYGRIDCRSAVAFTEEEIEALKDGISGQNSDGFGEGFEQREIDPFRIIDITVRIRTADA